MTPIIAFLSQHKSIPGVSQLGMVALETYIPLAPKYGSTGLMRAGISTIRRVNKNTHTNMGRYNNDPR